MSHLNNSILPQILPAARYGKWQPECGLSRVVDVMENRPWTFPKPEKRIGGSNNTAADVRRRQQGDFML
jgi:hypothetical protein